MECGIKDVLDVPVGNNLFYARYNVKIFSSTLLLPSLKGKKKQLSPGPHFPDDLLRLTSVRLLRGGM